MTFPTIIQGGMGVAVSNWRLARAVSEQGQLGVVSGTLIGVVHARLLQQGDPEGHLRRAHAAFPWPEVAARVRSEYFVEGGIPEGTPYRPVPMPSLLPSARFIELTVLANFVEVYLAREGHGGVVGLNLLEKVQLPTLPSLYGAMLAGVDVVLMGAGIPRAIPGVLDGLARGEAADLRIDIEDAPKDIPAGRMRFDPQLYFGLVRPQLKRPAFFAIVSSVALATSLARKASGSVEGLVVELPVAGGHNAPPRGPLQLNERGEPVYGDRDVVDFANIRDLGLPFWLAGAFARPGKLAEAQALGATGIQVGTAFALCDESGILPTLKRRLRAMICAGEAEVLTDPRASPTGFPFKVVPLAGSLVTAAGYAPRRRICDLGYLRKLFRRADGTIGYRCPGEPEVSYMRKGGDFLETKGRQCLCNGLAATVGVGQSHGPDEVELALVTAGEDLPLLGRFFDLTRETFQAADVIRTLLSPPSLGVTGSL